MGNMVTDVCAQFIYDKLRIDKVLGNWKSDDNNNNNNNNTSKNKKNFCSALWPVSGPKTLVANNEVNNRLTEWVNYDV